MAYDAIRKSASYLDIKWDLDVTTLKWLASLIDVSVSRAFVCLGPNLAQSWAESQVEAPCCCRWVGASGGGGVFSPQ